MPPTAPRPERGQIDWDDGVASERTTLAWERTSISTAAAGILILRGGIVDGPLVLGVAAGAFLIAVAAYEWHIRLRLYAEHVRPWDEGAILHERLFALLAVVALSAAAASVALMLLR